MMPTHKDRKNDEQSYVKMLKQRRDLSRAVKVSELIKRRARTNREQIHRSIEVFEKRYQAIRFSGHLLSENTTNAVKTVRPALAPIYANQYGTSTTTQTAAVQWSGSNHQFSPTQFPRWPPMASSDEDESLAACLGGTSGFGSALADVASGSALTAGTAGCSASVSANHLGQDCAEEEGSSYHFKFSKFSQYHKPTESVNWPCTSKEENGVVNPKHPSNLTWQRHQRPETCVDEQPSSSMVTVVTGPFTLDAHQHQTNAIITKDSLSSDDDNDINLCNIFGESDEDKKMLELMMQECESEQKTWNTTTYFWDDLLNHAFDDPVNKMTTTEEGAVSTADASIASSQSPALLVTTTVIEDSNRNHQPITTRNATTHIKIEPSDDDINMSSTVYASRSAVQQANAIISQQMQHQQQQLELQKFQQQAQQVDNTVQQVQQQYRSRQTEQFIRGRGANLKFFKQDCTNTPNCNWTSRNK